MPRPQVRPLQNPGVLPLRRVFRGPVEVPVGAQAPTRFPNAEQSAALKRLEGAPNDDQSHQERITRARRRSSPIWTARSPDCSAKIPTSLVSTSIPPRVMRVLPRGNWMDDSGPIVLPDVPASLPPLGVKDRRAIAARPGQLAGEPRQPADRAVSSTASGRFASARTGQVPGRFRHPGIAADDPRFARLPGPGNPSTAAGTSSDVRRLLILAAYRQSSHLFPAVLGSAIPATCGSPARLASGSTPRWSATMPWPSAACCRATSADRAPAYQPAGYRAFLNFPKREYVADKGEGLYRRGLYTYWQ